MKHSDTSSDNVIIHDKADRRQFIRRGAAFVATAGLLTAGSTRTALAADCDQGGPGGEKPEHGGNGSDSDAGEGADPTGCGKNQQEQPKISQRSHGSQPSEQKQVAVAKIIA